MRLAPQGHGRGQAVEADIHNRTVREGRVKGVRVLAVQVALVARRVLAVVDKGFTHFANFRQGLLQQQEIRQAGGFKRFEQHHLVFAGKRNGRFHFLNIRCQRLLANHMLFMAEEQLRLREVQGVRAGDIDRVNGVALRHLVERGEEMLNEVVVSKTLRLLEAAGIDRGKFIFAGFVGGVDELARDPVRSSMWQHRE